MRSRVLILMFVALATIAPEWHATGAQTSRFQEGDIAEVVPSATGGMVPVREAPSNSAKVLVSLGNMARVTILEDQSVPADGLIWWNIEHIRSGIQGWLPDGVLSDAKSNSVAQPVGDVSTAVHELVNSDVSGEGCWTALQERPPVNGVPQWDSPPAMILEPETDYFATILTEAGEIRIDLLEDEAPDAVNNFVCLASNGYYDGTSFHRVFRGFLIQGGDPSGTGEGGPGYAFEEVLPEGYTAGDVAMANSAPDANGAQFFIAADDLTDLIPHDYPVFGRVTVGLDVVDSISKGTVEADIRGERTRAVDPVGITTVTIHGLAPRIGPPDPGWSTEQPATATITPAAAIVIEAHDIFFSPDEISIPADTDVTITVVNRGMVEHNFTIKELRISRTLPAGEELRIVVNAPAGSYEFFCNKPGHREAGMVGTLIVGDGEEAVSEPTPTVVEVPESPGAAPDIELIAKDILFEPKELTAEPLQPQTIVIANEGAAPHNFSIDELDISVDLEPGEIGEALIFAPAGEYEFYCNVPGHREAGMTGTLTITGGSSSSTTGSIDGRPLQGCEGLKEYQTAYEDAIFGGLLSHPEAFSLLLQLESIEFESDPDALTPGEWRLLGETFATVAAELSTVPPPAFAAAWHENQIEAIELISELCLMLSADGSIFTVLALVDDMERIDREGTAALDSASSICPEFRTWALQEGLTFD